MALFLNKLECPDSGVNGGPDRDRTDYLVIANDALSQMSYRPFVEGGDLSAGGVVLSSPRFGGFGADALAEEVYGGEVVSAVGVVAPERPAVTGGEALHQSADFVD